MHALLKVPLLCSMIMLVQSYATLQAASPAVVLKQHSQLQLAQSRVPPPARRPVSGMDTKDEVPLPSRRAVNETDADADDEDVAAPAPAIVAAPANVEANSVSSGEAPQTVATETDVSTTMLAPATREACIAQVQILHHAARDQKIRACTEVLARPPAELGSLRKEALKQRALAYAIAQRSLAIADYSVALEIDPTDVESLLARGLLQLKEGGFGAERGRYDLAFADFNQAIALSPRNAQAFVHRGDAHHATHATSQAQQDYRQALEIDPASESAKIRLDSLKQDIAAKEEKNEDSMTCRNRSLDPDKRIEACGKFIATIPEFYSSSYRILVEKEVKPLDKMTPAMNFDMGVIERGYAFAFRALAYYDKKNDLESTLVDLNHAIDRAPILINGKGEASMRDRMLLRRGEIYLESQEYDRAEADFRAVLKVNFVVDGHASLAMLYFTREQYDRALSEISLTLKRNPKHALAYSLRGRIWLKQQQYQSALQDCQMAVDLTKAPDRALNAERCIEAARQALAQTSSNAPPLGKAE